MPTLSEFRTFWKENKESCYRTLTTGFPTWSCPTSPSFDERIEKRRAAIKRKGMSNYKVLISFTELMVLKACKNNHTLVLNSTNYYPDGTPYYSYKLTPTKDPSNHE